MKFLFFLWIVSSMCEAVEKVSSPLIQNYGENLTREQQRELIRPFFDEAFYKKKYGEELRQSQKDPLEHFLSIDWKGSWEALRDPNSWFNTVLYRDRLMLWKEDPVLDRTKEFPCRINPLVEWLSQPPLETSPFGDHVVVFAKKEELQRAWMAIEGFLRQDGKLLKPALLLSEKEFPSKEVPLMFTPQQKRGLDILFYPGELIGFYESSFLKFRDDFVSIPSSLSMLGEKKIVVLEKEMIFHAVTRGHFFPWKKEGAQYSEGRMYYWTQFHKYGLFDPRSINVMTSHEEPKTHRLSDHYSLFLLNGIDVFFGCSEPLVKEISFGRLLPGNIAYWGGKDAHLLSQNKEFSVSFLLSLGQQGMNAAFSENSLYGIRCDLWKKRENIKIPQNFWVSRRQMGVLPKEFHALVLPEDSKDPLFKSMYSVAIENFLESNFFTEKLIDCLLTITMPIYIGCPNIGDFFDLEGFFIVKDADEIISIVNSLDEATYYKKLPVLQKNKDKCLEIMRWRYKYLNDFYDTKIAPQHKVGENPLTDLLIHHFCQSSKIKEQDFKDVISKIKI